MDNGVLCREWYPQGTGRGARSVLQVVAPSEIRQRLLQSLHNSPSGGHLGRTKTLLRVRQRFYWPHYKEDVIRWCKRCDACARSKSGPVRKRAKLGHVPVGAPLERAAIDIMGPLPQTDNGHEYLLVVGDYFTKWAEAYPLQDHTAQTVADVLVEQFVSRYGLFRTLHSDQDSEFESQLIAELCRLLRVKKTRTVPYNPKSDGLVEWSNRTLKQMLSTLVDENQFNWDDHIPYILMAYRASVHESTKCTPNLLMLNRETNLPVDLMCGSPPETPECPVEYVEWVRQAMQHAFNFVRKNLQASTERHKTLYNQKSGSPSFNAGESVWRFYPPIARKKFGKKWDGPYLVVQKVNNLCYRIQKSSQSPSLVVHVDHLKLYEGVHPVKSWVTTEIPVELQEGNSQQEVHVEAGEQPVSESLIEGHLGTSVQPEDLQLPDDHNNSDEDSSELNPSPIPSTSRDPNLLPLDRKLGSRCSSRPRKPKIQADYFYY